MFFSLWQQIVDGQSQALDPFQHGGPFFSQETLAFAATQFLCGLLGHEHAQAAAFLHQVLVGQFLIGARDGDGVELVVGRHLAHRGQGIAGFEDSIKHHGNYPFLELAVDGSAIAPLNVIHDQLRGRSACAKEK